MNLQLSNHIGVAPLLMNTPLTFMKLILYTGDIKFAVNSRAQ